MVSILMATYNGEKFIEEQLKSLLKQTYKNFTIYICDDCSTDHTFEILKKFETKYPDKIKVKQRANNSGSAKFNFMELMCEHRNDEYIMLCDQDDVWCRNKVEISLKRIQYLEKKYGKNVPLLVHSDLTVVDEQLRVISNSMKKMINVDYGKTGLNNIVLQNTVTGCTCIYNQALSKIIRKPEGIYEMHDWWLAITASAFGKIDSIEKPTIFYRQHRNNSVGVKNMRSLKFIISYMKKVSNIKFSLNMTYEQANSFHTTYNDVLSKEQRGFLTEYCKIPKMNKWRKIFTVFKLKAFKNGFIRNLGYMLYI